MSIINDTDGNKATVRTPTDASALVPALVVEADLMGFDGTNMERLRVLSAANPNLRIQVFDGSTAISAISAIGDGGSGIASLSVGGILKDGTNAFSPARSASAANLGAQSGLGAALVSGPGEWSQAHQPAANTQATTTRAAGGAGVRHVCTSIVATLSTTAAATAIALNVFLRDGAPGVGTVIWGGNLAVSATAGDKDKIVISGLNIVGSAATAMTLECSVAGGANTLESVALTGYDAS